MIKALILDLDNTLYDENLYFFAVFKEFSKKHLLDYIKIKSILTDDFRLNSSDIFTDTLRKIDYFTEARHNELFTIYQTIDCKLKLDKDALEIISYAQKKNIKLAIITNGEVLAQQNKIKVLGLHNEIEHIIYARENGIAFEKPHEQPFLIALKRLKINSNEVLFVGDHPLTDIEGAKKVGIKSIRIYKGYAAKISYKHDETISSLLEIKKHL